jgi:hypothetical protein
MLASFQAGTVNQNLIENPPPFRTYIISLQGLV